MTSPRPSFHHRTRTSVPTSSPGVSGTALRGMERFNRTHRTRVPVPAASAAARGAPMSTAVATR